MENNDTFARGFGWGIIIALLLGFAAFHLGKVHERRGRRSASAGSTASAAAQAPVTGLVPETHAQPTGI